MRVGLSGLMSLWLKLLAVVSFVVLRSVPAFLTVALPASVLVFLCGCALLDLLTRRIPNRIAYSFLLYGTAVGTVQMGFRSMLTGLFLACGIGILLLLLRAVGGADVKLGLALGAAFGPAAFLSGMAYTVVIAGAVGVVSVVRWIFRRKGALMQLQSAFLPYMAAGFVIMALRR